MATSSTPSVFSKVQKHVLGYIQWERSQEVLEIDMGYDEYTDCAVLVSLFIKDGKLNVLLTKRSEHVRVHKGEVSFPGGKSDPKDKNIINTALREAKEETNLPEEVVNVIGSFRPIRYAVSPVQVYPVIATLMEDFDVSFLEPNDEVAEIFHVPLEFFLLTPAAERFSCPLYEWKLADDKIVEIFGFTAAICAQVAMVVHDRLVDGIRSFPFTLYNVTEYLKQKVNSKM